jgi:hypothetical protein
MDYSTFAIPKPQKRKKKRPRQFKAKECCEWCGSNQLIDPPHHILFKQAGGSSRPEIHSETNTITLCRRCHDKAHGLVPGELITKEQLQEKKKALNQNG